VLTPGENALVNLIPGEAQPTLLKERVGVNVNTLSRGSAYPGTLMGAYAFIKQALYDGIDQQNRRPEKPDSRLAALGLAGTGQILLIYAAHTENDIKRALRLGKEFSAKLIILGGRESEKVIPLLKERNTPVILTDDWLPAIPLNKAGIPFALASNKIEMTAAEASELREKFAALVEKGLSPERALAGLTRTPAELLGVGSEMGAMKPGMLANLAVVEGDLAKKESKVKFVFIKGQRVDSAPVVAEGPKTAPVAEDGRPYANVYEDDTDDHGDGGAR
jgi:imidazolonepropionase-like amidohydrolase